MGNTQPRNAREVSLIPFPGTIFPISITPSHTGCHDLDPLQAMYCMVVETTLLKLYVSASPLLFHEDEGSSLH